jgi:hypothetical protein
MPPKIRRMTTKRQFTLLLSGDDAVADSLQDSPTRGLPHERFLLGETLPAAPFELLGLQNAGQLMDTHTVLTYLQPVHLHATRDHLVLMHPDHIPLTATESAALLEEARPLLEDEFKSEIIVTDSCHWFVNPAHFASLATHSVDQVHGRNIDWWLPRDTTEPGAARAWRKLQNEIQMLWHISPINEARQANGLPAINSIWISGIGSISDLQSPDEIQRASRIIADYPVLRGVARHLAIPSSSAVTADTLLGGFAWLQDPAAIWPILQSALLDETLDELELIDFPNGVLRKRTLLKSDIKKGTWAFWRTPTLLSWHELVGNKAA